MASTCIGCGLDVDGDGKLIAHTTNGSSPGTASDGVQFPCGLSAYGTTFCDPATGQLHGPPDHTTIHAAIPHGASVDNRVCARQANGSYVLEHNNSALVVTNPSSCRRMIVDVRLGGRIRADIVRTDLDNAFNYDVFTRTSVIFNGGAPVPVWDDTWTKDATGDNTVTITGDANRFITNAPVIAPGGSLAIGYELSYTVQSGPFVCFRTNTPAIEVWGWTI